MTTFLSTFTKGCGLLCCGILTLTLTTQAQYRPPNPTIGSIDRFADGIDALIPEDAVIEVLASGLDWSEGPVWVADESARTGGYVLKKFIFLTL